MPDETQQRISEAVDAQVRQVLGMNAAEPAGKIYHCADPRLPQFAFEWHPGIQKVYRIDLPGKWVDRQFVRAPEGSEAKGFCIAEHVMTHALFLGFVQTFCRGYLKCYSDWVAKNVGTKAPERILMTDPCPGG